jgi:N-sulfoglucosamine sulfohydrolase
MSKFKVLLISVLTFCFFQVDAADRMNILLIISDDHGTDALGCYGNPVIATPALDQLAADGIRFTNAFCTSASCSASRSVIMTGRFNHATAHYGHAHGYHHFSTYDNEKSLVQYLEEAGYRTGRMGKYHLAPESVYRFEHVLRASDRNPVEMADNCTGFIEGPGSEPFFLYYCTADPHRGGGTLDTPYAPNAFGNRPQGYSGITKMEYSPDQVKVPDFLPDSPECRAELAQYYQSVNRVDQGVAKLIEILKETGKYENTLIIYISDNGIAFPGAKTTLYDPGMKLPCIIKQPGWKNAGKVTDHFISWVDLTPTILDYIGAFPEENRFHGRSFRGTLEDPLGEGPEQVYASHTFHEITMYYPMRVVRTRKWKFIFNIAWPLEYPSASDLWASPTWQSVYQNGRQATYGQRSIEAYLKRPQFELYDIENDPGETNNLAYEHKYWEIVEDLKVQLRKFMVDTDDPWKLKWDYE